MEVNLHECLRLFPLLPLLVDTVQLRHFLVFRRLLLTLEGQRVRLSFQNTRAKKIVMLHGLGLFHSAFLNALGRDYGADLPSRFTPLDEIEEEVVDRVLLTLGDLPEHDFEEGLLLNEIDKRLGYGERYRGVGPLHWDLFFHFKFKNDLIPQLIIGKQLEGLSHCILYFPASPREFEFLVLEDVA